MDTHTDDDIIIEGCLKNNRNCQHLLYDKYATRMLAVCMRFSTNKTEAEDLMIEGFMIVFTNLSSFRHQSSLASWIRAIMVNHAISYYRKNEKFWNMESIDENPIELYDKSLDNIPTSISEKEIMQSIQEMPPTLRYTLNLIAFEGMNYKEVANQLNITETTVRSRFSKAKAWLSQRILS